MSGALCDILWSDPMRDDAIGGGGGESSAELGDDPVPDAESESARLGGFLDLLHGEWSHNQQRGCSTYYGYKALKQFLDIFKFLCALVQIHF